MVEEGDKNFHSTKTYSNIKLIKFLANLSSHDHLINSYDTLTVLLCG